MGRGSQARRAPLPRDGVGRRAGAAGGVHGPAAVPGVSRQTAPAREPLRPGAREEHRRRGRVVGRGRAGVLRIAAAPRQRPSRPRPGDRRADPEGGERPAPVPEERGPRIPHPRAVRGVPLGRRGAAHSPRDPDRQPPRRCALHSRRAVGRSAPARQRPVARDPQGLARPRQYRAGCGARRGDDPLGRPRRGPGSPRRPARRRSGCHRVVRRDPQPPRFAHRALPAGRAAHPGSSPAAGRRPRAPARRGGRAAAQPPQPHRRVPAGTVHCGHGRVGLGEVHARHRHLVPRAGPPFLPRQGAPGGPRPDRRARPDRQGDRRRPEPHRPDAPLEPRDLHRAVHADPRAVHLPSGIEAARLRAGPVLVQREGRALRGVPRGRTGEGRDALPPRRVRPVRSLQGTAL